MKKVEEKLIGFIHGELNEQEGKEMREQIDSDPDVAALHQELLSLSTMVQKAAEPEEEWKMDEERRTQLMATLAEEEFRAAPAPQSDSPEENPSVEEKKVKIQWKQHVGIAACVAATLVIAGEVFELSIFGKLRGIVAYNESKNLQADTNEYFLEEEFISFSEEEAISSRVGKKPSSPNSSSIKVSSLPVPMSDTEIPEEPSVDFGETDGFGDGFMSDISGGKIKAGEELAFRYSGRGSESFVAPSTDVAIGGLKRDLSKDIPEAENVFNTPTAGLRSGDSGITADSIDSFLNNPTGTASGESKYEFSSKVDPIELKEKELSLRGVVGEERGRRQVAAVDVNKSILAAREAYANKEFQKSVDLYKQGLATLPQEKIQDDRREFLNKSLAQASGELVKQKGREGDIVGTGKALEDVLKLAPSSIKAEQELNILSDPLRTNPVNGALTKDTPLTNELRLNLSKGEGFYSAGLYDETRSRLLTEVDKAWGIIPAPKKGEKSNVAVNDRANSEFKGKEEVEGNIAEPPSKPTAPSHEIKNLNDETTAQQEEFSTFSLHVSDVSFKLAEKEFLENGQLPDRNKIRPEEFLNAFDYGDPSVRGDQKVACALEQAKHPFMQQRNLMRVSMSTAALGRSQPLRLTILLDNSGSMEREDREASVLKAMEVLVSQLQPQDEVSLISFAQQPRIIAEGLKGEQLRQLVQLVKQTPSEGGTNMELALNLAGQVTKRHQVEGSMSRIVLMTDGAANLGNAAPEDLSKMVVQLRQQGIAFDACGVGAEKLDDSVLEALARKGDGRYYLLDKPEDADENFVKQLAGALRPAASNVKVQVKFNPNRVGKYKLLGFEKHLLQQEDFRNDQVDAAEMAAQEAGSAMYQFETLPGGEGDVGEVFIRFRDMNTGQMVERSWKIPYVSQPERIKDATPSMQLATTAAMLAEKMRNTDVGLVDFSEYGAVLGNIDTHFGKNKRVQSLIQMVRKIRGH